MKAMTKMILLFGLFFLITIFVVVALPGSNYTVYVDPPSGGDDTAVLQAALDECMTGHPTGCTVQLSAGTYKSKQLIGESFHGSLKGMGMDVTIIQVLAPLEVTAGPVGPGFFDVNPPSRTNKYPMLIVFMVGDITVSDMTFKVSEPEPVVPWCYRDLGCGWTHLYGLLGVVGTSANFLVDRVGFEGGLGTTPTGRNYDNGPFFSGISMDDPLRGTFKVVSSRVRNGEDSLLVWGVRNAQIIIGGSPSEGNVVEPGALGGAFVDLDHSVFEYSYNNVTVDTWGGLYLVQGEFFLPQEASQFLIQHNTFNAAYSIDGILAADYGPPRGRGKTADYVIRDNRIQLAGSEVTPAWAGIEAVFLDGAVISNNRILGGSTVGIALEGASQCMIKANNMENLNADWARIGLLTADIYPSHDTTVVGFGQKANVYDEGFNNTLVGINNMQGNPPGPAIRDAMKRKMEMIKSIRKP